MRKNILTLFIIIPFALFSQTNTTISLDWKTKKEMFFGSEAFIIPYFTDHSFGFDANQRKLNYTLKLEEGNYNQNSKIILSNVIYTAISESELGELSVENISESLDELLIVSKAQEITSAFLTLNPIIKSGSSFQKITSFNYAIIAQTNNKSTLKTPSTLKTNGVKNSVLASGSWYRFYIEKSGVYKISKSFLQEIGFDVNKINPKQIQLFGNGGRMLPLSNAIYYPDDLTENAITIIGEEDGKFDNEDYILFYGEGVDQYNTESNTNSNLYDTKSYYYITTQGAIGKRMAKLQQPSGNATINLNTFDDHQNHELDLINIAHVGRQWFGESFEIKNEQEFQFNFPNLETTVPIKINVVAAAAAFSPTSFKITSNNQPIGTLNFQSLSADSETKFSTNQLPSNSTFTGTENTAIKISYNNNGVPGSKGYLDQINVVAKRKLVGYGKQFLFQYDLALTTSGIVNYSITNAQNINQVWDISDIYSISKIDNLGQTDIDFKANLGESRKYLAVDNRDYYTPIKESKSRIANQNIKGTVFKSATADFQDIDYVIITPRFLANQAEKLANFHRINADLNVKVLTTEAIYQEFSSGKQDIAAIRNCIKYIYQNASSVDKRIKYVNLFGDASFDYKDRINNNGNIVPIFHSKFSNSTGESSFASDDFYGLMDENEGNITSFFGGIDIAVGRMLVNTTQQADEMVNKVIVYHDQKSQGIWRNNFVLISDDSDKSSDASLQSRQNQLADKITTEKPFFNVDKIFTDSYSQEASAGGSRYPKARTDLFNAFEKGALVFNYLGHGGEDGLASERIWEKSDGQNLKNQFKYPLFITITCEFSRFDDPTHPTAGEYTYWNPKGGAIAMLTTIRSIGQYSAENFNDLLIQNLLSYNSNQYTSIAEVLRMSKNSNPSSSSNVIVCLGDPAIRLAIPKPKISLMKINDVAITGIFEDLKSLSKIKITGIITDENDNLLSNYNGELATAIFDKNTTATTLNNDGYSPAMSFTQMGETIFRGNASVNNGQFEFSFVVPRDIRIPVGNGKISFYSQHKEKLENQTGFNTQIKVGGINENAPQDNISPKVQLYMNDETFVSGGITNESPFLIANLEDENGINTASAIGHDIVAVLDGDSSNPYILNDYYQTKLDDFTNGTLRFPLRNLAAGLHTIAVTAWDVYNNPVTTEIQFIVTSDEGITLKNVLNYPNPFVNYTEFWFTHNRPYEPLEVQVQIMTITGKVIWTKNQIVTTDGFLSRDLTWNGRDDFGDKVGKGVYIYKLTVKSTLTNQKAHKIEKLVIL